MTDEDVFKGIIDEMLDMYQKKNSDYGNSVHKTFEEFGLTSFLVRLSDKLNRAITLNKQEMKVADERLEDTLLDLANYAVLALVELKKEELEKGDKNCEVVY